MVCQQAGRKARGAQASHKRVGMARGQGTRVQRTGRRDMLTAGEKIGRIIVLLAIIVLMLDLLYWRPY